MKSIWKDSILAGATVLAVPHVTSAQIADSGSGGDFELLLVNIMLFINDILIPFIIAIGFLFFVWGMFKYFILGGADEEKKAQGRSLMVNATAGFVLIIIFWGIVNLITSSTGLEGETIKNLPTVSVPKAP